MSSNPPSDRRNPGLDAGRSRSAGEQVLAHAQAGREIVQDFVALADSLEWDLGKRYLQQRGNKAFLADSSPVPYWSWHEIMQEIRGAADTLVMEAHPDAGGCPCVVEDLVR